MNIKSTSQRHYLLLLRRVVWVGAFCFLVQPSPADAVNFDMGEGNQDLSKFNGQSAGQGFVPKDSAHANSNVKFSDFGTYNTPNLNPQYNPNALNGAPADLLPINQQNTVDGLNINSVNAQGVFRPGEASGTSYLQSPQVDPRQGGRNINPYYLPGTAGARSSLPPVTTGIQAQFLPNAFEPIGSDAQHHNYGSLPGLPRMYSGSYAGNAPAGAAFDPVRFLPANMLPTTSLGSVNINVVGR